MTKNLIVLLICAFCALVNYAQNPEIEKDFEKNKTQYKLEKFVLGEDATSGFDYLIYKDKSTIVKVREIWSSSVQKTHRAEDYYYRDGKLIALIKYTFDKKYYRTAERGKNVPLKLIEKFVFNDSKLKGWIENGRTVPETDARWKEKEKAALESGKSQLENYEFLKDNN